MCLFPLLAHSLAWFVLSWDILVFSKKLHHCFSSHHIVTIISNNQKLLYSTSACVWNIEIKGLSIGIFVTSIISSVIFCNFISYLTSELITSI